MLTYPPGRQDRRKLGGQNVGGSPRAPIGHRGVRGCLWCDRDPKLALPDRSDQEVPGIPADKQSSDAAINCHYPIQNGDIFELRRKTWLNATAKYAGCRLKSHRIVGMLRAGN
jgi:hypothetical protein